MGIIPPIPMESGKPVKGYYFFATKYNYRLKKNSFESLTLFPAVDVSLSGCNRLQDEHFSLPATSQTAFLSFLSLRLHCLILPYPEGFSPHFHEAV